MAIGRHPAILAGAMVGLLTAANPASAVVVLPGGSASLPGTTAADEPYLAGVVLVNERIDFSLPARDSTDSITGWVQHRVVRENDTGTLDFYWAIRDIRGGSIGSLRIGWFGSAVFDANYRTDGVGTVGPSTITRFDKGFANFFFEDSDGRSTLRHGATSHFFFLHTDATKYTKTALFDVATVRYKTNSPTYSAYAPQVPEPETYGMMFMGLSIVGAVVRRRRARREAAHTPRLAGTATARGAPAEAMGLFVLNT